MLWNNNRCARTYTRARVHILDPAPCMVHAPIDRIARARAATLLTLLDLYRPVKSRSHAFGLRYFTRSHADSSTSHACSKNTRPRPENVHATPSFTKGQGADCAVLPLPAKLPRERNSERGSNANFNACM